MGTAEKDKHGKAEGKINRFCSRGNSQWALKMQNISHCHDQWKRGTILRRVWKVRWTKHLAPDLEHC